MGFVMACTCKYTCTGRTAVRADSCCGSLVVVFVYFQGIIDQIQKHKLLFIETQDSGETTLALLNYQKVGEHTGRRGIYGGGGGPKSK
jgi:hypothetical protein